MPDPLIIADPELLHPPGRQFWTTPEMFDVTNQRPMFYVAEVGKCFFGMSVRWVRHHLQIDYEDEQGEVFQTPRTKANFHVFRLWDIERWAHLLASHRVIDGRRLELVVRVVKTNAQLHNYLS